MDDASIRASDADRDRAVAALTEHLLAGRLTLEEYSERVESALRARVSGELARLQGDLPEVIAKPAALRRGPVRFASAIFSHVVRRGRVRLGRWALAATVCGDLDFDLREASIDRQCTAVTVLGACGNADIYVPEGVNVDVGGVAVFGHLTDRGRDAGRADAPTIRVRVIGLFATVDVWRVPRNLRDSTYREIINTVKGSRPELPARTS
jgi:Domain of unknown function (DUF1707)/Cell wall-active antibiotics response 4TMS YvqF